MKDFRDNKECRGIEPEIIWVVSYEGIPIEVQGFMDAWEGREGSYWCPEARFTISPEFVHDRTGTIKEALRRLAEKQARLSDVAHKIWALAHEKSP